MSSSEIASIEAKFAALEAKNSALEARVAFLERQVSCAPASESAPAPAPPISGSVVVCPGLHSLTIIFSPL